MKYLTTCLSLYLLISLINIVNPVELQANEANASASSTVMVTNSGNNGILSLRWVIENIEDGGTITFAPNLTINLESEINLGSKSVIIDGTGKNVKITSNGYTRIFRIIGSAGKTYDIKGLTIDGGAVKYNYVNGAGMYADLSSGGVLNVTNCIFSNNTADEGGGAYILNGGTFTGCTFNKNVASGSGNTTGGGVYAENSSFKNCLFTENIAEISIYRLQGMGGGAYLINCLIDNCIFNNNSALINGGGAWISNTIVNNCSFSGNSSTYGGGVFSENNSEINYSTFNDNVASENGGGAHIRNGINNGCVFKNNNAEKNGGGIYSDNSSLCINSVFVNNYSRFVGGGVSFEGNGVITNCTFYNNNAGWQPSSGAKVDRFSGKVYNSIFWNNTLNGPGEKCATNESDYSFCDIFMTEFPFISETDFNINDNAGGGSLCLDSGIDEVNDKEKDAAGNIRKNRRIDIGAYESSLTCLNNLVVANNSDNGSQSLRWAIDNICDGGTITFLTDLYINLNSEISLGNKSVNIDSKGKNITISGRNSNRVLNIKGKAGKIYNLTGLTFSDGSAIEGGGLIADMTIGTLNVVNCTFSRNNSKTNGGALSVSGGGSFVNCNFNNNTASWAGGGVYTYNGGSFINCSFGWNNAAWGGGGAYTFNGGTFSNCIFWNNSSSEIYSEGTGMSFNNCALKEGYPGTANIELKTSPFIDGNNLSLNTEEEGGYLCWNSGNNDLNASLSDRAGNNRKNGDIDLGAYETTDNYFNYLVVSNGNSDGYRSLRWALENIYDGGYITFTPGLTITLDSELSLGSKSVTIDGTGKNISISGNNVCRIFNIVGNSQKIFNIKGLRITNGYSYIGFGGGMFADIQNGSSLNVINCVFENNYAMMGGGVHANYNGTFTNCTFYNNSAEIEGSGVHATGGVSFVNCLLWNKDVSEIYTEGSGFNFSYCAVKDYLFPGSNNLKLTEFPFMSETDLALNESFEGGDICWASGNDLACNEEKDIAGNTRKIGIIDIGAYEHLSTCKNKFEVIDNGSEGIGTLRWAIENICDGGTIIFKTDMLITLNSELLLGNKSLTIDGSGYDVTISGNNLCRIFNIKGQSGKEYNLTGLSIINGKAGDGGGILSNEEVYAELNVKDCSFNGNHANSDGGAVKIKYKGTFNNCIFDENTAGRNGGGVSCYVVNDFYNCTFNQNIAGGFGGGMHSESVGQVAGCYFKKNEANYGGGVHCQYLRIDNTVLDQNRAISGAGVSGSGSWLTNCTFNKNNLKYSSGYYMDMRSEAFTDGFTFTNCLFWHDGDTGGVSPDAGSFSHCAAKINCPGAGAVILTESPFVDDELNLALNTNTGGGLLCIDAGNNSEVYFDVDIRGEERIKNSVVDIGAYEWKKGLGAKNPFPVNIWTGLKNIEWNQPSNWSLGIVPDSNTNAVIETSLTYPEINDFAKCRNLIINDGSVNVNPTGVLNVYNSILSDSTIRLFVRSDENGTGNLINNSRGVLASVEQSFRSGDIHLYTIPVVEKMKGSDIFSDFTLMKYSEENNPDPTGYLDNWVAGNDDSLIAGIGYKALYNNSVKIIKTVSLEGELVAPDFKIVTEYSENNKGWNLIGNPYPCKVNWEIINDSNINVASAIYLWNPVINNFSSWVNGVGNPSSQTNIINPMQAFFVKAIESRGSVAFIKEAKIDNSGEEDVIFEQPVLIRINVCDENGNKDESVIRIYHDATHYFDYESDAYKFKTKGLYPQIYSIYNGDSYSINSIPSINDSTEIPFEIIVSVNKKYVVEIKELVNYNYKHGIFLFDHISGTYTNLEKDKFIINANTTGLIKFSVCFSAKTDSKKFSDKLIEVVAENKSISIRGMADKGNKVIISNLIGQTIFNGLVNRNLLSVPVYQKGIYIVNVISGDGTVLNKKCNLL